MAHRRLTGRIPIWLRVPAIIALVLVGVLIGTMFLYTTGAGGSRSETGHGSRGRMEMTDRNTSGGDHSRGNHGSRGDHSGGDHGSGGDNGSDDDSE